MPLFGGICLPGKPDPANIQKLDVLPIGQIARMMKVGVAIDKPYLASLSDRLESKKSELKRDIISYVPVDDLEQFVSDNDEVEFNVESSVQVANLLFHDLRIASGERLKTTKSGKRISAGKKQLEALKRRHPVIPILLAYREASKLKSMIKTVVDAATQDVSHETWEVHAEIVSTRTSTGRLACRRPNLQNIGARSELGREFRAGFVARPGKLLISVDFSQIELRLLAHLANDPEMLAIFHSGGDIHVATAMRAFNISDPLKVDKLLHRAPCKNVNFAVGYGISAPGLYDLMALTFATSGTDMPDWLTLEWCSGFIEKWFDLYPKCREYFELQHYRARRYGIVWTPCGRVRRVPEIFSCHDRIRQAGMRQAGNLPDQGFAADIFKIAMARVERLLQSWRDAGIYVEALLPVHDELVVECDPKWADTIKELIIYEFEKSLVDEESGELQCRCPILADGHTMERWTKQ